MCFVRNLEPLPDFYAKHQKVGGFQETHFIRYYTLNGVVFGVCHLLQQHLL
jgi:hypothetical protein